MILNDKSLVAAMKKAAKHGGYKVLVDEVGTVRIFTGRWYVSMERLPRKVAALLVEHMGYLPKCGERLWITAKEEPQIMLEEVAEREASVWSELGACDGQLHMVPIMFQGWQVFQNRKTKTCYGVDPAFLCLLQRDTATKGMAVAMPGGRIVWRGDESVLVLPSVRPSQWEGAEEEWIAPAWAAMETVPLRKVK